MAANCACNATNNNNDTSCESSSSQGSCSEDSADNPIEANFLYMFDFVIDDLLIIRTNDCAPESYPVCCEITFRSNVFVEICDKEFGACCCPKQCKKINCGDGKCVSCNCCLDKCGKCCLFPRGEKIEDCDYVVVHVFKKKNDKCKFLLGVAKVPVKKLFDKVTSDFYLANPNYAFWNNDAKEIAENKEHNIVDNDCETDADNNRREKYCPTSEMSKKLLSIVNMKGTATGSLVLIMRLICNGPAIVSGFQFKKPCPPPSAKNGKCKPKCTTCL